MSLLDEVKAWPMPELPVSRYAFADPEDDGPDIPAYSPDQVHDAIRTAREAVAAEADARMARLLSFAESVRDGTATGSWLHSEACAALSEARKP